MTSAAAQTLLVNLCVLACNVGTGVILARALGPEGRGWVAAILLAPSLSASLMTLGLPNAMIIHGKRRPAQRRAIVGAALLLTSLLGVVSVLLAIGLVPWLLAGATPELVWFATWYACLAPLSMWLFIYRAHLESAGDFKTFGLLQVAGIALVIPAFLMLWWGGRLDAMTAATARAAALLVIALPMMGYAWVRLRPTLRGFGARCRELLSYGLREWIGGVAGLLGNEADKLVILGLLAASDLGLYTVALSVVSLAGLLQSAVTGVLFPKLAGQPAQVVLSRISTASAITLVLGIAVGGPLWAVSPWLVPFVYGEEFAGLTGLLACLLVAAPLRHMTVCLQTGLRILGHPGLASSTVVVQHLLSLGLMGWLTAEWGLLGTGMGIAVAAVPTYLLVLAVYRVGLQHAPPYPRLTAADLRMIRDRLLRVEVVPELTPAIVTT